MFDSSHHQAMAIDSEGNYYVTVVNTNNKYEIIKFTMDSNGTVTLLQTFSTNPPLGKQDKYYV